MNKDFAKDLLLILHDQAIKNDKLGLIAQDHAKLTKMQERHDQILNYDGDT